MGCQPKSPRGQKYRLEKANQCYSGEMSHRLSQKLIYHQSYEINNQLIGLNSLYAINSIKTPNGAQRSLALGCRQRLEGKGGGRSREVRLQKQFFTVDSSVICWKGGIQLQDVHQSTNILKSLEKRRIIGTQSPIREEKPSFLLLFFSFATLLKTGNDTQASSIEYKTDNRRPTSATSYTSPGPSLAQTTPMLLETMLIDSYLSPSDHIGVDVGVPSQVQNVLQLAVSVGELEFLSGDEVVRAGQDRGYYWTKARGNSTTPPRKSVKFWQRMKDWTPEKTVKGNLSKTYSNHTLLLILRSI